ncbi:uncharacterized protein EI90DRAFT_2017036 [Cantharellus anzutake]|uniref:uncharacterized protein n=1 Tax=Cantharellus anzutake TaxID=1750568 RepID=UPI001908E5CB|nr:uncharacterized protein EI90DRAFT_2017036 [Cantharellus anzutake]KAF8325790.1 hypothetical protein EI90DRAFT_2017036 [Cantharellus anzutake]
MLNRFPSVAVQLELERSRATGLEREKKRKKGKHENENKPTARAIPMLGFDSRQQVDAPFVPRSDVVLDGAGASTSGVARRFGPQHRWRRLQFGGFCEWSCSTPTGQRHTSRRAALCPASVDMDFDRTSGQDKSRPHCGQALRPPPPLSPYTDPELVRLTLFLPYRLCRRSDVLMSTHSDLTHVR